MTGSGIAFESRGRDVALMVVTWLVSLAWRDKASIVDPVWPLGFVVVAVRPGNQDGNTT